jgi:hypothetical protein
MKLTFIGAGGVRTPLVIESVMGFQVPGSYTVRRSLSDGYQLGKFGPDAHGH